MEDYWQQCLKLPERIQEWQAYKEMKSFIEQYLNVFPILHKLASKVFVFLHLSLFVPALGLYCVGQVLLGVLGGGGGEGGWGGGGGGGGGGIGDKCYVSYQRFANNNSFRIANLIILTTVDTCLFLLLYIFFRKYVIATGYKS